jgi:hypothetical protein
MTEELISTLKKLTQKIDSELDAHQFVRIYLNALNLKDRDKIYDALGDEDSRFKDIFVARMILTPDDFIISNGSIKLGGSTIPTLARNNNYHGVLYIKKKGSTKIVAEIYIPTSSFVPRNGTAAIPDGRETVHEFHQRVKEGEQLYGILEIRTEKYQEPEPLIRRVELGKRGSSPKTAVVNTQLFHME